MNLRLARVMAGLWVLAAATFVAGQAATYVGSESCRGCHTKAV